MNIRYCGFCDRMTREEVSHCPHCGSRLIQELTEKDFNTSAEWPFTPMRSISLRVRGRLLRIRFHGTSSIFGLWNKIHNLYENQRLYCRIRENEMDLCSFVTDEPPADCKLFEPGVILNCRHRKYNLMTEVISDSFDDQTGERIYSRHTSYQGSFELIGCGDEEISSILGWFVSRKAAPNPDGGWIYDI